MKLIQTACRTFLWTGKSAISKKALVAWDKLCMPQSAGGLNITDMRLWNKAAICKLLWSLAQKKDKIWVRWVHGYYIKDKEVSTLDIPQQSSWVIRKIIGAREYLRELQDGKDWLGMQSCSIKEIYLAMRGEHQRVVWHKLVSQNSAPPKCIFISWLMMHNSLATCEHLRKIGIDVGQDCCFCSRSQENMDHLFFGCEITGKIWNEITSTFGLNRMQMEWRREREHLISQCRTKNGTQLLYRCVFSITTYVIWRERNRRRMQGIQREVAEIINECQRLISASCLRNVKLTRFVNSRA